MTREQVKKILPEITDEQLKSIMDIHSQDIGKAKGEADQVKEELEKAKKTVTEYESQVADLKKSLEDGEDFKKKFEDLEKKVADDKRAAEEQAKAEAEEKALAERFKTVVGDQKWRDELTEKAIYSEFKTAVANDENKGKGDKELLDALTKDKDYFAQSENKIPSFSRGTGGFGGGGNIDDAAARSIMGLPPRE